MKQLFLIPWLIVLFIFEIGICEGDGASGFFYLSGSDQAEDNWMYENISDQGTNYSTDTFIYLDNNFLGTERRGLLRFDVLTDSMASREVDDSAVIGIVVLSESITAAELVVRASKVDWGELYSCWNFAERTGGETPDTTFWTAEGGTSSGDDFYTIDLDSVDISSVSGGDTIFLDVTEALDSGWYDNGFILYLTNASNEWLKIYSSEADGFNSFLYVDWSVVTEIESGCTGGNFGSNDWYSYSKFTALEFDCWVDSMLLEIDDGNSANDTVWPGIYRGEAASDSTLLCQGDSVLTIANDTCTFYLFDFEDSTYILKGDSAYFIGAYVSEGPDTWDFCTIGTGGSCVYGTGGSPPASLSDATSGANTYCPCYLLYMSEYEAPESSSQVIIIMGSCWNEEIELHNGCFYRGFNIGDNRYYRSLSDLVFSS